MKLRIISDIHTDINSSKQTTFDFGDDFVICCGDISGDRFSTEEWIRNNITNDSLYTRFYFVNSINNIRCKVNNNYE